MALIQVQNVSKYFGTRELFRDISFEIYENDHIGLIGVNGCGKSTLLALLIHKEEWGAGRISLSRECRIGALEQALPEQLDATLYDITLMVFDGLRDLERELENIADRIAAGDPETERLVQRQFRLQEAFERKGGLTYRSRTRATLLGLGFAAEELRKKVSELSGGETRKALLARLLLSDANLLLLDEPTNHLDLQAVEWLEEFLLSFRGAYLVVSHDRYFLDRVTTRTIEMEHGTLRLTNGNYSRHQELKLDANQTAERQYQRTLREIRRIEGIIEQQRRWNQARNYVTIASKQKQIDRLKKDLVKPEAPPAQIRFQFSAPEPSGNEVIAVKDLEKSFGNQRLFQNVSFLIKKGEHVCLLGANGCGKTTLLRMLLGREPVDGGAYRIGANVQIGYFEQTSRGLDASKTIYDEVWDSFPRMEPQQIRNALGTFLFRGDDVFKTVGTLSGGELARVQLLKLMLGQSNLLLLDEPTNHLDIPSREQLEDALCNYNGTLLIVTHDRYFINRIADRILVLSESGVAEFSGDWDAYRELLSMQPDTSCEEQPPVQQTQNAYVLARERRSARNRAKGELTRIEAQIAETEKQIENAERELARPELQSDYQQIAALAETLAERKAELDTLYQQWEKAEETLAAFTEE